MKYLNLSYGFNPYDAKSQEIIRFETLFFSGGEPHIKINPHDINDNHTVMVTHRINSMNDLGLLLVAVSALNELGYRQISLCLPYFPGARQDRVMVPGEPLTVKVYADIINDMMLYKVIILDPHSDVTPALIDECKVINNHLFVRKVLQNLYPKKELEPFWLISPDAGSNKKIKDLGSYLWEFNRVSIIKCDKTRNVKDGSISGFDVYADDLSGYDCVIVDDICSNGGTFMGLAKELKAKGAGDIYLVVTHGEFGSKKADTFNNLIQVFRTIYCTDSIFTIDDTWYNAAEHHWNLSLRGSVKQIKIEL